MANGRIIIPGPKDILLSAEQISSLRETLDPRADALAEKLGERALYGAEQSVVEECKGALLDSLDLLPTPITNRNLHEVINQIWDERDDIVERTVDRTKRREHLSLAFWSLANAGKIMINPKLLIEKPKD
jgi:hypothetical protein